MKKIFMLCLAALLFGCAASPKAGARPTGETMQPLTASGGQEELISSGGFDIDPDPRKGPVRPISENVPVEEWQEGRVHEDGEAHEDGEISADVSPVASPAPAIPSDPVTKPPVMTVSVGPFSGEASASTYSWNYPNGDGTETGIDACGMHPLEMLSYLSAIPTDGALEVTLSFAPSGLVPEFVSIRGWDLSLAGDYEQDGAYFCPAVSIDGDTALLTLPNERGAIFEVQVRWSGASGGLVNYVFALESRAVGAMFAKLQSETVRVPWKSGFDYGREPIVRVVRSAADWDALCAAWGISARDGYDEAFFAVSELIAVLVESGSGSVRFEAADAILDGAGITLAILCEAPEYGTEDMAAWAILSAVPKGTVPMTDPVRVVFPNRGQISLLP